MSVRSNASGYQEAPIATSESVRMLLQEQKDLHEALENIEEQIYGEEEEYIVDTHHGNILKGWDGMLETRIMPKKREFNYKERSFSHSSYTFWRRYIKHHKEEERQKDAQKQAQEQAQKRKEQLQQNPYSQNIQLQHPTHSLLDGGVGLGLTRQISGTGVPVAGLGGQGMSGGTWAAYGTSNRTMNYPVMPQMHPLGNMGQRQGQGINILASSLVGASGMASSLGGSGHSLLGQPQHHHQQQPTLAGVTRDLIGTNQTVPTLQGPSILMSSRDNIDIGGGSMSMDTGEEEEASSYKQPVAQKGGYKKSSKYVKKGKKGGNNKNMGPPASRPSDA